MGGGARETLTGRQGVIQRREAATCVQERRGLHCKTPEKRASSWGGKHSDKRRGVLILFNKNLLKISQ